MSSFSLNLLLPLHFLSWLILCHPPSHPGWKALNRESKIPMSFLFPFPISSVTKICGSLLHIPHGSLFTWPPHTLPPLHEWFESSNHVWWWILSSYHWTRYLAQWLLCKCFGFVADSPRHIHIYNNQSIPSSNKQFWEKNTLWYVCFSQEKNIRHGYICIMNYCSHI